MKLTNGEIAVIGCLYDDACDLFASKKLTKGENAHGMPIPHLCLSFLVLFVVSSPRPTCLTVTLTLGWIPTHVTRSLVDLPEAEMMQLHTVSTQTCVQYIRCGHVF